MKRILRSFGLALGVAGLFLVAGATGVVLAAVYGVAMPAEGPAYVVGIIVGLLLMATAPTWIIATLAGENWPFWMVIVIFALEVLGVMTLAGIGQFLAPVAVPVSP
jgi:hypothetical protein